MKQVFDHLQSDTFLYYYTLRFLSISKMKNNCFTKVYTLSILAMDNRESKSSTLEYNQIQLS